MNRRIVAVALIVWGSLFGTGRERYLSTEELPKNNTPAEYVAFFVIFVSFHDLFFEKEREKAQLSCSFSFVLNEFETNLRSHPTDRALGLGHLRFPDYKSERNKIEQIKI